MAPVRWRMAGYGGCWVRRAALSPAAVRDRLPGRMPGRRAGGAPRRRLDLILSGWPERSGAWLGLCGQAAAFL